jgi:hypothetical protein
VAKADLYNGRGFSVPVFNAGTSGTLAPPIVETNDTPTLIMSFGGAGSTIQIRRASNLGRSFASLSGPTNITVSGLAGPPSAGQRGTSDRLDVLFRFQDHGTQISNHVLNVTTIGSGPYPIPHWFQVNGNNNTLAASGYFYYNGISDDFNPSIAGSWVSGTASNPIGRMFFTWSMTIPGASGNNALVMASGRLATDSTTTTGGAGFAGSASFYNPSSDTVERWGDYSSVTLDPVPVTGCATGNRVWIVNEKIVNTSTWGSRIGRLGFC